MARSVRLRSLAIVAALLLVALQVPCLLRFGPNHTGGGSTAAAVPTSSPPVSSPSTPCPTSLAEPHECPPCTSSPALVAEQPHGGAAIGFPVHRTGAKPLYRMKIVVFTYDRLPGLKRLLQSLVDADYSAAAFHSGPSIAAAVPISLHVFCDFPKKFDDAHPLPQATRAFLDTFQWPHGEYYLHRREVNVGLKRSILEAWYPTADDEVAAFFEDDIEVSPLWFTWVDAALRQYVFPQAADEKLLGLSLFRPIHDELSGKGCVVNNGNTPFALQQPCSWGAVYLPKPWRRFRNWYDEQSAKGIPTLRDPADPDVNPSSNTWDHKSSWKMYLIKLMYGEGWYMVYPNLPDKLVLSTNHLMKGEHPTPPRKLFELPLLQRDSPAASDGTLLNLPPLAGMDAYDVMFRKTSTGKIDSLPNYR